MKNRITPYAAGWLSFLVEAGIATYDEAREAQKRVAQDAVRELEERRKRRKRKRDDGR